ncbi:nuclear pore complex protein Nup50 [Nerophis lumbriciformis]|uniref:nuclear pore complex protein Nup50 n=1 Tax=Nerophis lumbriciformis TaxID=546530 RepID=UPI002ADFEFD8|nr:nuclear pore complex protein Nup50-like [Nerophis lumbriciformis]XP_061815696.1 nuclear pore complex protein Nup50-like [Nerophis lumbriciformis]
MAKRIADKELTDRNWDQEEEGEEAGTFSVASVDVLKNRAIKKAKRRNIGAEGDGAGAFKGFQGFSMSAASSGSAQPSFPGFGNGGGFKGLGGLTNGNSVTPSFGGSLSSTAATTPCMTPGLAFNGSASADNGGRSSNGPAPSSSSSSSKEYSRQLTALNCSVRDWITKHVNDNPLCDLNPIFRDYERHLASIEKQYGASTAAADGPSDEKKDGGTSPTAASSSSSSSSLAPFSFSKHKTEDKGSPVPPGVTFNIGQKVDGSVLGALGSKTTPPTLFTGQSSLFGNASFSGTKSEDAKPAEDNAGGDDSYEPPKPEVQEVKEEDAFYSKKCKVFYKKEVEFKEKGVGTLHLKHTTEGKTQMIVRADTNLGNILLNIFLHATMPCSRVGKNNVMVVCVPNPPVDDKDPTSPVPLLIRVKTTEDADELHKTLEERKG